MEYYLTIALLVVYYCVVIAIFIQVLLENRNPIKTQSYLLLLILLPLTGLVIYLFFGVNYRKRKMFSRKGIIDSQLIIDWQKKYEQALFDESKEPYPNRISILLWRNSKASITANNEVTVLNNGEEKFPALFEVLATAKHHIHLEYYIFEEGEVLEQLKEILVAKVQEGVEVRMIYDSIGSNKIKNKTIRQLKRAGIITASYNPVLFTPFANKVNYRDHRKIVVVDGEIGFTGGINVSDRYVNNGKHSYWRDVHVKIKGEAVKSLQLQFFLNWFFTTKNRMPFDEDYFPQITKNGSIPTAIVGSQPDSDFASIMEAYYQMIHSAKKEVLIVTPYFVPNSSILTALKVTAKSGIKVKLLLPKKSDTVIAQAASLSYVGELLENNVEVYLYTKGMIHSKVIIVDREICSIGTANMDYRSFDNNAEINALFFDKKLGAEMSKTYAEDLLESEKITLQRWKRRPLRSKLVGSAGRLIAPLL